MNCVTGLGIWPGHDVRVHAVHATAIFVAEMLFVGGASSGSGTFTSLDCENLHCGIDRIIIVNEDTYYTQLGGPLPVGLLVLELLFAKRTIILSHVWIAVFLQVPPLLILHFGSNMPRWNDVEIVSPVQWQPVCSKQLPRFLLCKESHTIFAGGGRLCCGCLCLCQYM